MSHPRIKLRLPARPTQGSGPAQLSTSPDSPNAPAERQLLVGNAPVLSAVRDPAAYKKLIDAIASLTDRSGREVSDLFLTLPSKAEYPDYYAVINHPISIEEITKKIQKRKYAHLGQVVDDLDLMVENAKHYNLRASRVFRDAEKIHGKVQTYSRQLVLEYAPDAASPRLGSDGGAQPMQVDPSVAPPTSKASGPRSRIGGQASVVENGVEHVVGGFAHIAPAQGTSEGGQVRMGQIVYISPDGQHFDAMFYYYPSQTEHSPSHKFYVNEVFRTDNYVIGLPVWYLISRCFVLPPHDFIEMRPADLRPSEVVYVCELEYSEEDHGFHKIGPWRDTMPQNVQQKMKKMVMRRLETPLEIQRKELADHGEETEVDEDQPRGYRLRRRRDTQITPGRKPGEPPLMASVSPSLQAAGITAPPESLSTPTDHASTRRYPHSSLPGYPPYKPYSIPPPPNSNHRLIDPSPPNPLIPMDNEAAHRKRIYDAPPLDVLPPDRPLPSLEYLCYLRRTSDNKEDGFDPTVLMPDEEICKLFGGKIPTGKGLNAKIRNEQVVSAEETGPSTPGPSLDPVVLETVERAQERLGIGVSSSIVVQSFLKELASGLHQGAQTIHG